MSEQTKVKVGDTLYRINKSGKIESVLVEKVGRKHFLIADCTYKFDIDSLKYVDKLFSSYDVQLYRSKQPILDNAERHKLIMKMRTTFDREAKITLSLEQLRAIDAIIKTTI
jgi:hypothetical protein